MSKQIISIIVPTKNSSATLGACLKSIKEQTYSNIELLVVDNFSNDSTPEIGKKYADVFLSKGPERSAQINFAVQKSRGKYVCIIDSDMVLDSNVITECISLINSSDNVAGVITPEKSFGEGFWARYKKLERSFYVGITYPEILFRQLILGVGMLFMKPCEFGFGAADFLRARMRRT